MTATAPRAAAPRAWPHADRDVSWVDFDRRVLDLAADARRPLAERVKLCAIVSANLDEFFAVRVARLQRRTDDDARRRLREIRARVLDLQAAQDALWQDDLCPALAAVGVNVVAGPASALRVPTAALRLGDEPAFPHLDGGAIGLLVRTRDAAGFPELLRVDPLSGARFLSDGARWIAVEDALADTLTSGADGIRVDAVVPFRLTRSGDLAVGELEDDPLDALERQLERRPFGDVVRVEVGHGAPAAVVDVLLERLGVGLAQLYQPAAPIGLAGLHELVDAVPPEHAGAPWAPITPPAFADATPRALLGSVRDCDRLVHHPYESFEASVQAFAAAARDADASALQATVYRTSRPSATLASLVESAGEGKRAVCVIELRARFDEQRNAGWSRALRASGVDVLHGPPGAKVHAKLMALTRREGESSRSYVHIGTGNYHASNAFSYEDFSLFSADADLAADVEQVFDALVRGERPAPFRKLLVGPWYLRDALLGEIRTVTDSARRGVNGRIRIKVNSLGDRQIVEALYEASCAGVAVELVVRGICTLRPGIPGVSERISVRSVLGRFLEHSRIFSFESGGGTRMWLGSADLLTRNLDRRVETLAPVEAEELRAELSFVLDTLLADTQDAWGLGADGSWRRVRPPFAGVPLSAQETFMQRAAAEVFVRSG